MHKTALSRLALALLAAAAIEAAGAASSAAVIPIDNASFENAAGYWQSEVAPSSWGGGHTTDREEVVLSGTPDTGSPSGSNIGVAAVGNTGVNPNVTLASGYDGSNVLQIPGDPHTNGVPSTFSFLTDVGTVALGTYEANTTYTLTVATGTNITDTQHQTRSNVIALAASGDGFASGIAGKFADWGSVVASTSIAWTNDNFPRDSATNKWDQLFDYSVTLNTADNSALVGQSIGVVLGQLLDVGSTYNATGFFDNVRLTSAADAPVPEPASLLLLLAGAGGLLARRRH